MPEDNIAHIDFEALNEQAISQPLVKHIYTADPSAHVFNGTIYIYPSHDIDAGIPFDDLGSHFAMEDYHVLSVDKTGKKVTDHGIALHVKMCPGPIAKCGRPTLLIKMESITYTSLPNAPMASSRSVWRFHRHQRVRL
jgi:hypothetical protein